MPKKIIDDSDSSSESEPEQYDNKIVNDSKPKVKIIKLEKPKRVMSEKQLENLKRGRENRVKARQEKQLQETTAPTPTPTASPTIAPAAPPTPAPAEETIKEQKKPLSKLNKKQLKIEADLLNIDIVNLTNAQIIKKIRESQGVNKTQKPPLKIDSPKKKKTVKETIKEIHHHHYKDEEKSPKLKNQIEVTTPAVTIKKETKIINFV